MSTYHYNHIPTIIQFLVIIGKIPLAIFSCSSTSFEVFQAISIKKCLKNWSGNIAETPRGQHRQQFFWNYKTYPISAMQSNWAGMRSCYMVRRQLEKSSILPLLNAPKFEYAFTGVGNTPENMIHAITFISPYSLVWARNNIQRSSAEFVSYKEE